MAKCFMCGSSIDTGILCAKCDPPKKRKTAEPQQAAPPSPRNPASRPAPPAPQKPSEVASHPIVPSATVPVLEPDPFPKAPIVPFPVQAASLAITSIVDLLVATAAASILVAPDRTVKFVSEEARKLFGLRAGELPELKAIEGRTGVRVGELSDPARVGVNIDGRNLLYALVPLSGGAGGAALVFRDAEGAGEAHATFTEYVHEAVFGPLRGLRDSLAAAAVDHAELRALLSDAAATLDYAMSSLELAPGVGDAAVAAPVPTITDVVHRVAEKFRPLADMKQVRLQIDSHELQERMRDYEQLGDTLAILMDNALHYVPAGGQVVIGVRWMEHKAKPLYLFFVMDTGPFVPEPLRQKIFEPAFTWDPAQPERTGRKLFHAREFAVAHGGSVWVESRTGKACSFFLRVRPDNVQ